MESGNGCVEKRTFKEVFKFYKRKNVPVDLTHVYDLKHFGIRDKNHKVQEHVEINKISRNDIGIDWCRDYKMIDSKDWSVFTFSSKPGLIHITNPFTPQGQRYWIARNLKDYTKKPSHLNIDAHNILNENDDWWECCQSDTNKGKLALEKLRWATLGYHHNWDTKKYSEESKSEFPTDLKALCRDIGAVLGFENFNAEAGIINIYHEDSSLNGHVDHSEVYLDAPLFSFSFGQSAIFLIGGRNIDEEPIPLLVESGDIIIMSKDSRLFYHGVPRIFCSNKTWNVEIAKCQENSDDTYLDKDLLIKVCNDIFWKPFEKFISKTRINMNIRQVLFPGQVTLPN